MKTKILGLFSILAFLITFFSSSQALAVSSGAVPVRKIYSQGGVLNFQYSQLIASTVKGLNGIQVNNTGIHAVAIAFGSAGSEVNQVIVGGNQDTAFMPVQAGYATRVSVITLDGPNETGELQLNAFYN